MKLELSIAKRIKTGKDCIFSISVPEFMKFEYRELVKKGQPNDLYHVIIENVKKKRSTGPLSQNHHLNGHCMQISKETGQDFETVKLYLKRKAITNGLRIKTKPNGEIVYSIIDGEPVPISESEMSVEECAWCIEEAHALSIELGIILREDQ